MLLTPRLGYGEAQSCRRTEVTDLNFKKTVYCLELLKIFLSHDKPQKKDIVSSTVGCRLQKGTRSPKNASSREAHPVPSEALHVPAVRFQSGLAGLGPSAQRPTLTGQPLNQVPWRVTQGKQKAAARGATTRIIGAIWAQQGSSHPLELRSVIVSSTAASEVLREEAPQVPGQQLVAEEGGV